MAFVVHMYTYLTKLSSFSIHCHRDMTKTCILCSGSITQMQFFFVTLWLDYVTNPCCTGSITLYIYTTMHEKVRGGGTSFNYVRTCVPPCSVFSNMDQQRRRRTPPGTSLYDVARDRLDCAAGLCSPGRYATAGCRLQQ